MEHLKALRHPVGAGSRCDRILRLWRLPGKQIEVQFVFMVLSSLAVRIALHL